MTERKSRSYAVRTSGIHGRGVFATRKILKGTIIVEYKGQRTSYENALQRSYGDAEDSAHTFLFELDDGRVIDAGVRGNAARWINHSCDPNCKPIEDVEGRIFIKAKRTIREGEELSYNYRLGIEGRLTKRERAGYACRCGSAKCRGTLLADGEEESG